MYGGRSSPQLPEMRRSAHDAEQPKERHVHKICRPCVCRNWRHEPITCRIDRAKPAAVQDSPRAGGRPSKRRRAAGKDAAAGLQAAPRCGGDRACPDPASAPGAPRSSSFLSDWRPSLDQLLHCPAGALPPRRASPAPSAVYLHFCIVSEPGAGATTQYTPCAARPYHICRAWSSVGSADAAATELSRRAHPAASGTGGQRRRC